MKPQLFRKKPVVIEAVQFNGLQSVPHLLEFCPAFDQINGDQDSIPKFGIKTLEGTMEATTGDWIIKGVKGEFYPCKPDIFEATYEPAEGCGNGVDGRVIPDSDGGL